MSALVNPPKVFDDNVKDMAKALYVQGIPPVAISRKLADFGVKAINVSMWASRGKWSILRDGLQAETDKAIRVSVETGLEQHSKAVRETLASELVNQVSSLSKRPIKHPSELRNTPERQGRAAYVKTIVESADKVFGWSSSEHGDVNLSMFFNLPPDSANVDKTEPIDI